MKRVVTGFDDSGRAVILKEGSPARVITFDRMPGLIFEELCATESRSNTDTDDSTPDLQSLVPGTGGTRFRIVTIPPGSMESGQGRRQPGALRAAARELAEKLPGCPIEVDPLDPAMHVTQPIDYGIVLSGEVTLEL